MGYSLQEFLRKERSSQTVKEFADTLNDSFMRCAPDTRHLIVYEILVCVIPFDVIGEKARVYLTENEYQDALAAQSRGEIKIHRHALVVDGALRYEKPGAAAEK